MPPTHLVIGREVSIHLQQLVVGWHLVGIWLLDGLAWLLDGLAWLLEGLAWLLDALAWLLESLGSDVRRLSKRLAALSGTALDS